MNKQFLSLTSFLLLFIMLMIIPFYVEAKRKKKKNKKKKKRNNNRHRRNKQRYPWRAHIPEGSVDPITLDPLNRLWYPPFALAAHEPFHVAEHDRDLLALTLNFAFLSKDFFSKSFGEIPLHWMLLVLLMSTAIL